MEWIAENWQAVLAIVVSLGVVVGGIIKLTPSKKDDEIFDKYVRPVLDKAEEVAEKPESDSETSKD